MPTLILTPDDVAKVVDKLPPPEERNRVRGNLHAALQSALPAITEALNYRAEAEQTMNPFYDTVAGAVALLDVELYDEAIGDVHSLLYYLSWATRIDSPGEGWRDGLAELTERLS